MQVDKRNKISSKVSTLKNMAFLDKILLITSYNPCRVTWVRRKGSQLIIRRMIAHITFVIGFLH